jgi:hypothetical protein
VVGLDPTDRSLLDDALHFVDGVHAHAGIFNAEQFGLTEVLRTRTKLRASDDVVTHYWGFPRPFFHRRIEQFFERNRGASYARLAERFADVELAVPNHPLADRLWYRVKRKRRGWSSGYSGVCLAVRAAFSDGDARHGRDVHGRDLWRHCAYDWLAAELEEWRGARRGSIEHWFRDPELGRVRDEEHLRALPEDERERWRTLWAEAREAAR